MCKILANLKRGRGYQRRQAGGGEREGRCMGLWVGGSEGGRAEAEGGRQGGMEGEREGE